jgi:hypothetical protein
MARSAASDRLKQIRKDVKVGKLKAEVAYELIRAERLSRLRLYTEAAVRLGRAVEADLYATARDLGIDLTDRIIPKLEDIRKEIQGSQTKIALSRQFSDISDLSAIVTRMVVAMLELANNSDLRSGESSSEPRRNRRLYQDFRQHVAESNLKMRLATESTVIDQIQEKRNRAAHAAIAGGKREISAAELRILTADVEKVLGLLRDVRIGTISQQRALAAVPLIPVVD